MLGVSLGCPPESTCFPIEQTAPWLPVKLPRCSQIKARMRILERWSKAGMFLWECGDRWKEVANPVALCPSSHRR